MSTGNIYSFCGRQAAILRRLSQRQDLFLHLWKAASEIHHPPAVVALVFPDPAAVAPVCPDPAAVAPVCPDPAAVAPVCPNPAAVAPVCPDLSAAVLTDSSRLLLLPPPGK